jgi:hypothetical protein
MSFRFSFSATRCISKFKMKFFGNRNSSLATDVAVGSSDSDNGPTIEEKQVGAIGVNDDSSLEHMRSRNVQEGVKKVEAVTLSWTKNELILAYTL